MALTAGQGWLGSGYARQRNKDVPHFIKDDFAARALSSSVLPTVACLASNTAALLGRTQVGVLPVSCEW